MLLPAHISLSLPLLVRSILAGMAMILAIATMANAQETAPLPTRSSEAFDDWIVQCATKKADDKSAKDSKKKPPRTCEAVQGYTNNKTKREIARLAFAYASKGKDKGKMQAGARMLVDVSFKNSPKIVDADKTLLEGKFRFCVPQYCYVAFELKKKSIQTLNKAKKPALQYSLSNGRTYNINISAKGLDDALKLLKARQ